MKNNTWEEKVNNAAEAEYPLEIPGKRSKQLAFKLGADFAKSKLHAQIEQLQAENQKLRTALEEVEKYCKE